MSGAEADGEVCDTSVLGFAGAVRNDAVITVLFGKVDGADGFGKRANLVRFDKNGVADLLINAFLEEFSVGNKKVVAD